MTGLTTDASSGVVFVHSGHGCQWPRMALDLIDASPLFAERIHACEQALKPHVGWSLIDVLRQIPRARRLQRVDVVQPALFAVTVSLAELWRACGVTPDAVVGHSQGEVAAAHIAGGLSLEDAAMVVARRSRTLVRLSAKGGMIALSLKPDQLADRLESGVGELELGAVNGPASLAVAGERRSLDALLASCKASGIRAGRVAIDYASHSRQIEPLRDELVGALSRLLPRSGEIPFFSTVTGDLLDTAECGAEHWYRAEREMVKFEPVMRALLERGHRVFVEVSPHPVLAAAIQETVDAAVGEQADVLVAGSLRRDHGGPERFMSALAALSGHGVSIDWDAAAEIVGGKAPRASGPAGNRSERHAQGAVVPPPGSGPDGSLALGIEGIAAAERARLVQDAVSAEVASTLEISALEEAMMRRAFKEIGLDSSGVVELRNRLRALTGLALSSAEIFDHPTPVALAAHLLDKLTSTGAGRAVGDPARPTVSSSQVDEPIAIVGMSCRFAGGVSSPRQLWELLLAGEDAIGGFPVDRGWDLDALYDPDPDHSGTSYAREGGFLHDAAEFDAAFFGISPREAIAMDPQQRLFLEAGWEAVEAAGIDCRSLAGSQTGVYAGINTLDYNPRAWLTPDGLEGHNMIGGIGSVVAGRVSYVLGLHGPAITVDTACSSSLVALHLACAALRRGECSMALSGGVSVMVTPGLFAAFSRQRALAADGRCKSFAQSADGTGWGEGIGVLLLERLSDAQRYGHDVMALVRGSAVNQDGASNGLAAPNGLAQQQVIRQALASASLTGADVDAVEAHGTGTELGDPIEAHALLATYGQERPTGRPLWLGSVKSNIGHTQAAAGVAGVIKMVMALRHGVLPKTLHVDAPTGEVDWSAGQVALLTDAVDWPHDEGIRRAGVSSYGISGTNAHVILEEAPRPLELEEARRPLEFEEASRSLEPVEHTTAQCRSQLLLPWVLSGRNEPALVAQATRLKRFLAVNQDLGVEDVGFSLASRSTFEHRAVIVGDGNEQLREGVAALASAATTPNIVRGVARSHSTQLALMFTGQGSQRAGMGSELYGSLPIFREAFDEVCAHMDEQLGRLLPEGSSLRDVVFGRQAIAGGVPERCLLDDTLFTQTGLFALEVALHRVVEAWGVEPDFVMGHSIGELVAAYVAGVYSLRDACRLVVARGRLMEELPAGGAMVAVQASEQELAESLVGMEDLVALAGVNGPASVVLSGEREAVLRVARLWEERGRKTKRLRVSHGFHSPLMDAMLEDFRAVAEEISFDRPSIPVVSNLSGEPLDEELCSAEYWVRHVREPVRFADGLAWLRRRGVASFLELGPDGVLSGVAGEPAMVEQSGDEQAVVAVPAMRSGRPEMQALHAALAQLWVNGTDVVWVSSFAGLGARPVELPTYAFQRERYWLDLPYGCWLQEGGFHSESGPDGWLYRVQWKPSTGKRQATLAGRWLVVVPSAVAGDPTVIEAIATLEANGARVVSIEVDPRASGRGQLAEQLSHALCKRPSSPERGPSSPEPDPSSPPGFHQEELAGVLSMLALEETPHDEHGCTPSGLSGTLALIQALGDTELLAPLWIATRGAVSVGSLDRLERPLQAMAWGLGRVLRLESPGRWGGLVDLPLAYDERAMARLPDALAAEDGEDEVALRPAAMFMRRLTRGGERMNSSEGSWAPSGTALVSGGTGALGGHLARRLAHEGTPHILLATRRGPDAPGARELERELVALGARVTIAACDVADRDQLTELLAKVPSEEPLSAVFHVAGVLDDALIDELSLERLARVIRSKVDAAWILHELTAPLALEAFVVFSSISATFGGGGQAAYAAGNAYLDALAEYRRARGLPATAIAWGAWSGEGMAAGVEEHMHRRGVRPMAAEPALDALWRALECEETHAVVADIDWERYARLFASSRPYRSIVDLPEASRAIEEARPDTGAGRASLATRLGEAPSAEHERVALELVQAEAALVLGHRSPAAVHPLRAFRELGFDSLSGVELRNRLATSAGVRLPSTLVFDHPTPTALARHLLSAVAGVRPSSSEVLAADVVGDPVAIVAMACRFPGGADSPERLWDLLHAGTDGISPFPTDRDWDLTGIYDPDPEHMGTIYTREGGFIDDAVAFDAAFFGIGPREALAMSPQQRLLLEVCWETLEKGGIDPHLLRGSATGVFMGESFSDYSTGQFGATPEDVKVYLGTGNSGSVVSGRVAYTLGLEGPALTVNTACSSSLVALHLAAGSLRAGECELALVGGVTVMATPAVFLDFSRQRGSAPDGRSKSFADGADGAGWGEGVGVVALERLSDARRNGHEVLAIVRGSAINQDGASNGLTAPSGPAQQRVIRQALANAGLSAREVDAVEAHGTGTRLGDPIEAQALLATYGQERDRTPLWLGSLKSNIGHTQAAAGIAGLIKMVMALRREQLPRTLHVHEPSRQIDWAAGAVSLLTEEVPWPRNGHPRRAGVSSFGISGTNAHVIIEEPAVASQASPAPTSPALAPTSPTPAPAGVVPWLVSARGKQALHAQAGRLRDHLLANPTTDLRDIGLSLSARAQLEYRAVILGKERQDMLDGLGSLADAPTDSAVLEGMALAGQSSIAFLFTGQGAQHPGMGSELNELFPVFKDSLEETCGFLDMHLGRSLRELMFAREGSPEAALLDETVFTQAALFALEVALFRLVESLGVHPTYLIGHSIGELAAAHLAGVFSPADACALVAARGRLMGELPPGGAMVAVQASEREMLESLADARNAVSIAAVNAPGSVVLSGEQDAVLALAHEWEERGRKTRRLRVSHAFHSARMDGMLERFAAVAADVAFSEPTIPVVSNLTGQLVTRDELCSADYWVRHVRETVRFADGVRFLAIQGVATFLEIGPDGVLSAMAQECLDDRVSERERGATGEALDELSMEQAAATVVPALRAGRGEISTLLTALGRIWVSGAEVDWARLFDGTGARRVEVPTYAFQRKRFWLDSMERGVAGAEAVGQAPADHPLLGAAVALAGEDGWLFTGRLTLQAHPWLADHVVLGKVLLPGTAFLELALYAASQLDCVTVRELALQSPLVLPEDGAVQLQLAVGRPDHAGVRSLSVHSRRESTSEDEPEGAWVCHAAGSLAAPAGEIDRARDLGPLGGVWPPAGAEPAPLDDFYERLGELGLEYGPSFRGLTSAWLRGEEIFAEATLPAGELDRAGAFGIHPALLDAALHATALANPALRERSSREVGASDETSREESVDGVRLPFCWNDVRLLADGAGALRARFSPSAGAVEIAVADDHGRPLASIGSLVTREASTAGITDIPAPQHGLLHLEWRALPVDRMREASQARSGWVLVGAESPGSGSRKLADLSVDPHDSFRRLSVLREAIASGQRVVPEVVLLDCTGFDGELPRAAHTCAAWALGSIQELLEDARLGDLRLAVITCGALAVRDGEDVPDPAAATVWGMVRSAQIESPRRLVLVDLDGEPASWESLALALESGESQLAIRDGRLLVPRLARPGSDGVLVAPQGASAWRVDGRGADTFEGLSLVACPEVSRPLEPAEVRVAVRAAGVNFKDVLIALGVYPGEATIGNEAAGVVLEVGSAVAELVPGDRVMGLFSGAFGPLAITDNRLLARAPEDWSFAQAASVPLVFLTAYYALVDLAALQPHERVLVHAATGGVGTAAAQLARHLGAEVFATASAEKWGLLERKGLDATHIASSRELSFRERFLERTGGAGMDVVLNALAGEFVDASLDLLVGGGRFVEMGKTDVRDPAQVAAERQGVLYKAFDLMDAGPVRIGEMFAAVMELFERGELTLPPLSAWDVRRAPEALRFMSQARHVGKIVLNVPVRELDSSGTVLVTGGTGGLGSMLAKHLARNHGVRHLLLASRAGEDAAGADQLREELEGLGATVRIAACDVSRREQLEKLIASIGDLHPLRAVVHAAGALDDGLLDSLTPERVDRVFAPKLDAAWHLHELTAHMDLDAFVLFASVAGTLGAPGQANYAAANSFLDALACHRRARGLPAVAMAWGPWEQASGMTGRLNQMDLDRMASSGMLTLSPEQGLALFDSAWVADGAVPVLARLDGAALRERANADELPSMFEGIVRRSARRQEAASASSGSLAMRFMETAEVERGRVVLEFVRAQTAAVLGYASPDAIDSNMTFKDLGFDSLAAVELRNRLGGSTDLQLPATLVFDYPTLGALAGHLRSELTAVAQPAPGPALDLPELVLTLSSISAEEARRTGTEARLREILAGWAGAGDASERYVQEEDLTAVADEEIFELIDREFGVS